MLAFAALRSTRCSAVGNAVLRLAWRSFRLPSGCSQLQQIGADIQAAQAGGEHRAIGFGLGDWLAGGADRALIAPAAVGALRLEEPIGEVFDGGAVDAEAVLVGFPIGKRRVLRLRRVAGLVVVVTPAAVGFLPRLHATEKPFDFAAWFLGDNSQRKMMARPLLYTSSS